MSDVKMILAVLVIQTAWCIYRDVKTLRYQEGITRVRDQYESARQVLQMNFEGAMRDANEWRSRANEFEEAIKKALK